MSYLRAELDKNLTRLRAAVPRCCNPPAAHADRARLAAERIPFAHSTSMKGFEDAWTDGALLSQAQIAALRPGPIEMGKAETLFETTDDVFLYLSAFAYPNTSFGFLFNFSLGEAHHDNAVGTPFDTGGFAFRVRPPAGVEPVPFVRAHEMPVPECRGYLGDILTHCFQSVSHYLRGDAFACPDPACAKPLLHPQGVTDPAADDRARTHEVRVPQRIELSLPHLLAVFYPAGAHIPTRLKQLRRSGVALRHYPVPAPSSDDSERFLALRTKCEDFIITLLQQIHA